MHRLVRYVRRTSIFKEDNSRIKLCLSFNISTAADSPSTALAPPPIQVLLTESAGRGVFATRSIGAGELIHTAKPVVSHPSLSKIHNVCYFCLKLIGNRAVSHSNGISFCSDKCRQQAQGFYEVEKRADWSVFDDHCRVRGIKYPLLVKRLACFVISGVASDDCVEILQPAHLSSQMILQMEEEFHLLRSALENAEMTDEQIKFLTKEWYVGVLARIQINAFRIELIGGFYEDLLSSAAASVDAEAAVGNSVYILPSFYNHDCDPNAHILWIENVDARIKALRDIEPGEELRICYIDASMDFDARQTLLSQGFGFQCTCLRCLSKD